jgi:hypothetical protein
METRIKIVAINIVTIGLRLGDVAVFEKRLPRIEAQLKSLC